MTYRNRHPWTPEEDALLLARYDGTEHCAALLAEELGRTTVAVRGRCSGIELVPLKRRWTPEEDQCLRNEYPKRDVSAVDLARRLGRTEAAIQQRAWHLGVSAKAWTPEEDRAVMAVSGVYGGAVRVASEIGRTAAAVRQRRIWLSSQDKQSA
ncbi:MAG: hypothetical protein ACFB0C_24550 [Leptolyngbyaceae cyanobacterium]